MSTSIVFTLLYDLLENKYKDKNVTVFEQNGQKFVSASYKTWATLSRVLSISTVRRAVSVLKKEGLITLCKECHYPTQLAAYAIDSKVCEAVMK